MKKKATKHPPPPPSLVAKPAQPKNTPIKIGLVVEKRKDAVTNEWLGWGKYQFHI